MQKWVIRNGMSPILKHRTFKIFFVGLVKSLFNLINSLSFFLNFFSLINIHENDDNDDFPVFFLLRSIKLMLFNLSY